MARHSGIYNGSLSTKSMGSRLVRVQNIQYGIEIVATEGESSQRSAFYPAAYDGSAFALTLVFMDFEEREKFNEWLRTYMEKVVHGHGFYASMTAHCPARSFTRVGIPQDAIQYGEGITDVGYQTQINFLGVTDPADPNKSVLTSGISYFKWPKKAGTSKYFYPAGRQLSGAASLAGTIFDTTPEAGPQTNATVAENDLGIDPSQVGTQ